MRSRGFTLIELVSVIILLAILGVLVVPRFSFLTESSVQAGRDDLVAALFYGQQLAMARASATNPIQVVTTASTISVTENGNPLVSGNVQYPITLGAGVEISPEVILNFDRLGRTAATELTVSKDGVSATVTVSDSGYAN